jgi:hypothetical protein
VTILLLISDDEAVREMIPGLDGDVMRCPTVGAARRFLASEPRALLGMVAWGPDVVSQAEEHWRLEGWQLGGVPHVAVRVNGGPWLSGWGMEALGLLRVVPLPAGLDALNAELWGGAGVDAA